MNDWFEQEVRVPKWVRIAMAGVVALGGVLLSLLGIGLVVRPPTGLAAESVLLRWIGIAVVLAMGFAFVYVGIRLLALRAPSAALLGPRARSVAHYAFVTSSIAMALAAWKTDSPLVALNAIGLALFAYAMLRVPRRP